MEGFCQIMENLSYKKNDESDEQGDRLKNKMFTPILNDF